MQTIVSRSLTAKDEEDGRECQEQKEFFKKIVLKFLIIMSCTSVHTSKNAG